MIAPVLVKYIHYSDVIMTTIASQITSLMIVYSTVYSGADQRKHQSSASLAFVWGIHRGQVNSPHKWPVTRKMFPFDDVIMQGLYYIHWADGRLTARSSEVSKPWDSGLNFSNRSEIWQALWQHRCRDACRISERYDYYNIHSRGFETCHDILR